MAAKRTAKVKVSRVQGINKNTYVGDSIVSEDMFPEGNFDLLIGSGHLEEIKDKGTIISISEKAEEARLKAESIAKAKADADKKAEAAKKAQK